MGEVFMIAGIITAIILCFVGIVKLPFGSFKGKHPKLYKATFTFLSIVFSVIACVITQLYVLESELLTTEFTVLLISTFAGVFGLYSSYEGLGFKAMSKTIVAKLQELTKKAPESKFTKYVDKIGLDKAIEIVEAKKESDKVVEQPVEQVAENTTTN